MIDGHPLFREAIVRTLEIDGAFEIVGEGSSIADALRLASESIPNVMVIELSWPAGDTTALSAFVQALAPTKVLLLSPDDDGQKITEAFRCGVRGYLMTGASARELVEAVHVVVQGKLCVSRELMTHVLAWVSDRTEISPARLGTDIDFTEREAQVLQLLAIGKSNKQIAFGLGLCEKTVKHHVTNILRKLRVDNRVEAALFASRQVRPAA